MAHYILVYREPKIVYILEIIPPNYRLITGKHKQNIIVPIAKNVCLDKIINTKRIFVSFILFDNNTIHY